MQGSGGIRKIRWEGSGRGKPGGTRIIYYWYVSKKRIIMLLAYQKNVMENLTRSQMEILQQMVKDLTNGK